VFGTGDTEFMVDILEERRCTIAGDLGLQRSMKGTM
jgi:hypothetical protein